MADSEVVVIGGRIAVAEVAPSGAELGPPAGT